MHAPMWFTFENDYDGEAMGMDDVAGILLDHTTRTRGTDGRAGEGLVYTWVGRKSHGLAIASSGALYGDYVASEPTMPSGKPATISLFGMLSFMNSPYIPKNEGHLPRQQQRANSRHGFAPEPEPRVLFVDLRPALGVHDGDTTGQGATFHHRWIVRGHHRAQWYPSQQAHKVIWIAPHVKGPDGAPLKEHVYRVIR